MERKLVSIQTVENITPIEGADQIVAARVMGWNVVVKKGEFQSGDPCVFFEIDSVLPQGAPWAEFLRPHGFRVKTLKLRGVLSQGLALPVSILGGEVPPPGIDLRERLGVIKYEPALPDTREVAGPFPAEVPKTDELRLQSALGVLDELRGRPFYVSTKCDGTSATFFRSVDGGALVVCSRNWALRPGPNPVWRVVEALRLSELLPPGMAVQGELCGPGIQKNRLGLASVELRVFSAYDARPGAGRFLGYHDFESFCAEHGLTHVPIEQVVQGEEAARFEHSLDGWLERARGFYTGTKNRKEGIVVRPLVEAASTTLGGRLSFKVLNNDYLLKDED
ncbi:RNA ligase family protein [Hyalangium sp.]|uniref:RNA ligase family protein n=1 Tax=Hyalangium sp. TaxID=2028555 RepID=UPI002D223A07|nr:RNA ligase family protein [Hyalangium sp.]HYH97009.1 RNA ligase family protein [Hyalangium sp.]